MVNITNPRKKLIKINEENKKNNTRIFIYSRAFWNNYMKSFFQIYSPRKNNNYLINELEISLEMMKALYEGIELNLIIFLLLKKKEKKTNFFFFAHQNVSLFSNGLTAIEGYQ